MRVYISFAVGALFGIGLLVSGMTDTTKVQGWLDIFGDWDATLAFVMMGAIIPMAIAWLVTRGRRPVLAAAFPTLPAPRVDSNLVLGSTLFGMGWALSGLCPGPAIASLGFGGMGGLAFFGAMIVGMFITPGLRTRLDAFARPA